MRILDLDSKGLATIADLVSRPDVCSVACDYGDPQLWKIFLNEQAERAKATGLPPQVAFSLCGPDSGLPHGIDPVAMGGEVHIPYEGITGGDLFIQPHWRLYYPDRANAVGSVRAGNGGKECHHMLTAQDFGELANSLRTKIGKKTLYESTLPYRPSDPHGVREAYARQELDELDGEAFLDATPALLSGWFDGRRLPTIFPAYDDPPYALCGGK